MGRFYLAAVPGMRIFLGVLSAAIGIKQPCHVERRPAFWAGVETSPREAKCLSIRDAQGADFVNLVQSIHL